MSQCSFIYMKTLCSHHTHNTCILKKLGGNRCTRIKTILSSQSWPGDAFTPVFFSACIHFFFLSVKGFIIGKII